MHQIKEEIRESVRINKMLEFLENFENGNPEDFITRGDIVEVLKCFWEATNQRFGKK